MLDELKAIKIQKKDYRKYMSGKNMLIISGAI